MALPIPSTSKLSPAVSARCICCCSLCEPRRDDYSGRRPPLNRAVGAPDRRGSRSAMLKELLRAFALLGDPQVRRIVWLGIGLSLLTFLALLLGVEGLLNWAATTGYGWLDRVVDVLGVLGTM